MRSRWSAEEILTWLAVVTMEAAWITLAYVGLEWTGGRFTLELNIAFFALGVAVGMLLAGTFEGFSQTRLAAIVTAAAIAAAVLAAVLAGGSFGDPGALLRLIVINPGSWLLGLAVVRGAIRLELADTLATERVFSLGIPFLVVFWIVAWFSGLSDNPIFTAAAFTGTLSFVAAGLFAVGLGRLADLEVEAIDRGARRRWLVLLLAIIGSLLILGVPLAALLGLPISSALAGILGPLPPVLFAIFSILAIPIFGFLDLLLALIGGPAVNFLPQTSVPPAPSGEASAGPAAGPPPDFTWLVLVIVIVFALVVLRAIAEMIRPHSRAARQRDVEEVRASEPFSLPELPRLPHLRLPRIRHPVPLNASQAYLASLAALAPSDAGRTTSETPREHAARIASAPYGRDMALLAADYQLGRFGERPLSRKEEQRAMNRWRRVTTLARQLRPKRPEPS